MQGDPESSDPAGAAWVFWIVLVVLTVGTSVTLWSFIAGIIAAVLFI